MFTLSATLPNGRVIQLQTDVRDAYTPGRCHGNGERRVSLAIFSRRTEPHLAICRCQPGAWIVFKVLKPRQDEVLSVCISGYWKGADFSNCPLRNSIRVSNNIKVESLNKRLVVLCKSPNVICDKSYCHMTGRSSMGRAVEFAYIWRQMPVKRCAECVCKWKCFQRAHTYVKCIKLAWYAALTRKVIYFIFKKNIAEHYLSRVDPSPKPIPIIFAFRPQPAWSTFFYLYQTINDGQRTGSMRRQVTCTC